ncbi:MAG: hypothetical protein R3F60_28865 [bacterium]
MKPIHLIAGLGGLAIVGVVVWYLQMASSLPYETTTQRGIPDVAAPGSGAPTSEAPPTEAAPSTEAAVVSDAAPATAAAPDSGAEAPATDAL